MNWIEEAKLYLSGKLPTDVQELENLLVELGISQFNTAVTKFGKTGLDTYEAQRRIREALAYRWKIRFAIVAGIAGVIVWLMRALAS